MAHMLRIAAWNIGEGRHLPNGPNGEPRRTNRDGRIPDIAREIRVVRPDIVMLNEICDSYRPWSSELVFDQVAELARLTHLPHTRKAATAWMATDWMWKNVAVLSRYPLGPSIRFQVPGGDGLGGGYAFLVTSAEVSGTTHWLASLRFESAKADPSGKKNTASCQMLRDSVAQRDTVFAGGDYNRGYDFAAFASLLRPGLGRPFQNPIPPPDTNAEGKAGIDHVLFRGYYHGNAKRSGSGNSWPSDHPIVTATFTSSPDTILVRYGDTVSIRHSQTGAMLRSHPRPFSHAGTSGQQAVGARVQYDDNELWRILPSNGTGPDFPPAPVLHNSKVRIQHVRTGRNLHSHTGFSSPISRNQEVTCFGEAGVGDDNDNWTVEVAGGGALRMGVQFRLRHGTGAWLTASSKVSPLTFNEQEVCALTGVSAALDWFVQQVDGPQVGWEGAEGRSVALRSHNFPTHYIRHREYLAELTAVVTDLDRRDSTFLMTLGLARGADAVSFKATNVADHYLRHQEWRLKLHPNRADTPYLEDATFTPRPGLAGHGTSFESVNAPGRYLRHRDSAMWVEPSGPAPFPADATFHLEQR